MNEEELKKLIEEYDKNVQILEKQQEKKNISWLEMVIKNQAKDEFEAEMFMREEINFLQEYTKTKRRAQKELDFIRVQADKFGFNFVPFAASYANEFEVELWEEAAAEAKEKAEAMGVQFYYPDIKPFQEKMKDLHAEYTQDESMKAVYDKIRQKGDEILAKNASVESGK